MRLSAAELVKLSSRPCREESFTEKIFAFSTAELHDGRQRTGVSVTVLRRESFRIPSESKKSRTPTAR
jgi:hypothetical protein